MVAMSNMYPAQDESDPTISDFTAILRRESRKNKTQVGDKTVITATENYISSENPNLSSILQGIQDDGPADAAEAGKPMSVRDFMVKQKVKQSPANTNTDKKQQEDIVSLSTASLKREKKPDFFSQSKTTLLKTGIGSWFQLLLLLTVISLLVISFFHFNVRTNALEKSLIVYEDKWQNKVVPENAEISTNQIDITEKLLPMQIDLQLVKTANQSLATKESSAEIITALAAETHADKLVSTSAATLVDEIASLKTQLQSVKIKLKETNPPLGNIADVQKDLLAASQQAAATTQSLLVDNRYSVAIASFKRKNKAEMLATQITDENLSPKIKQAMVNGQAVYRLTVHGFTNRQQADAFVLDVADKYGLNDAWIRKNPLQHG